MRYVSLFTGIGGFDLALDRAGHIGLAMVEKDKACQNVLRKRFPNVLLHDDVMTFGRKDVHGTVDIVAGGSPCQAFSVAGLRQSLCDHRGNLAFEFIRICNELQPKYVIWENVPGVLSTRDNAFGCFLAGLVGEDTPLVPAGGKWTNAGVVAGPQRSAAWRILDAQYFGVAQRRRRVFVVASAASAERSCIEILFEREGVRRDSPPSREARESVAGTVAEGVGTSHETTPALSHSGRGTSRTGESRGQDPLIYQWSSGGGDDLKPTAQALRSDAENNYQVVVGPLRGNAYNNSDPTMEAQQLVIQQNAVGDPDIANGVDTKVRHDYDNQVGTAIVAFTARDYGTDAQENVAPTMRSLSYTDHQAGSHGIAVAFDWQAGGGGDDKSFKGKSRSYIVRKDGYAMLRNSTTDAVLTNATVRRLTPVECERLQAFPDGWTDIPQANTPRYKQLGNAVCVNVVEWIARRL